MTLSKPVLTAEAGEGAVKLIWTTVTGAQRFVLMVWTSAWQQIGGDDLTGTNFSHTGLTVGTTYFYAVLAVNAAGQYSPWSHYLTVAVPAAPASESDLSVPMLIAAPEQSRVLLNWSSVPDAMPATNYGCGTASSHGGRLEETFPNRHDLHPHRCYGRDDLLLRHPHSERQRKKRAPGRKAMPATVPAP